MTCGFYRSFLTWPATPLPLSLGGASMRKTAVLLWALVLAALFSIGSAQQRLVQVKLQLKWFPQAQFAGYFVAKEQGFFRDEGLEVTLLPIGDQSPIQTVV